MSRDIKTNSGFNGCNDCNSILRSQMVPRDLSKFGVEKITELLKTAEGDYNNYYVYVYVDKKEDTPSNGLKATAGDSNTKGVRISLGELLKTASQVDWEETPNTLKAGSDGETNINYKAIKNRPNVWTPDVRLTPDPVNSSTLLKANGDEVYVVKHSVGGLRAGTELPVGELNGMSAIDILKLIMGGEEGKFNIAFGMIENTDLIETTWIRQHLVGKDRSSLLTDGYTDCPEFHNAEADKLPLYYSLAIPASASLDLTFTSGKYTALYWSETNPDMKFNIQLEAKEQSITIDGVTEIFRIYYPAAPIKYDTNNGKLYFKYTFEDRTPRALNKGGE